MFSLVFMVSVVVCTGFVFGVITLLGGWGCWFGLFLLV